MIKVSKRQISCVKVRSRRGGGLIEGVIGLMMIVVGSLCAMVFLTDVGMSLYYKQKLGFAASQTALYAACLKPGNDDKITDFAHTLLSKLGNGTSHCNVKHEIIRENGKVLSQVTIDDELPLMASQFQFLPFKTRLQDNAIAIRFFDTWREQNPQFADLMGGVGSVGSGNSNAQTPAASPAASPWGS